MLNVVVTGYRQCSFDRQLCGFRVSKTVDERRTVLAIEKHPRVASLANLQSGPTCNPPGSLRQHGCKPGSTRQGAMGIRLLGNLIRLEVLGVARRIAAIFSKTKNNTSFLNASNLTRAICVIGFQCGVRIIESPTAGQCSGFIECRC